MMRILLSICLLISLQTTYAQMLDRIVAVIGDEIILESDVDNQFNYLLIQGEKDDGTLRCGVMNQLIVNKLLLNKARQDSVTVTENQVLGEANRRIEYFLAQMNNDQAEFEKIYGKTIIEFREDIKPDIEKELLTEQMRQIVLMESTITPREVKKFFAQIPKDSTGFLPAEVMVNQIVVTPPYSEESKQETIDFLSELRRQVMEGTADFAQMAKKYSQGPSSRDGGDLKTFGRGQMTPLFEAVVFNMREGEISEPFETEFGYHIVKLHKRTGEVLHASHILRKPSPSDNADSIAQAKLIEIKELINSDSLSFEQAAIRFSDDRATKDCGGCITNPKTGELRIPMDALPADLYFKIDEMVAGEISKPLEFSKQDNSRAYHLLYLKKKIPPHRPNLKDDYKTIRNAALRSKQSDSFEKWIESAKRNIYIDIKPTECSNALKTWIQ